MRPTRTFPRIAVCAVALALAATAASAQATRTWVSGVGDDANPCSRTAPCKTFAGAISKTAAGGEISVLDNGSFGAVTITKAITINGDANLAGVLASLTNGIIVNAGVNDRVVLRNLSINGVGNGINGIRYLAGKQLVVDRVTIQGFTTRGIDVAMASSGRLVVQDSTILGTATGIRVTTTSGLTLATVSNTKIHNNTVGIEAAANGRINVTNSVVSNNSSTGILGNASTAVINANNCEIGFNELIGVNAAVSGATIRIASNHIYNNTQGVNIAAGGIVSSDGQNRVAGNGSSTAPNGPAIVLQ